MGAGLGVVVAASAIVSGPAAWQSRRVIRVLDSADLPLGRPRCVQAHGCRIALVRTEAGVFALDDACPHRGGPLSEGDVEDGALACPIHGWAFELSTGQMRGTSGVRVGTYPVEEVDGEVRVGPRRA